MLISIVELSRGIPTQVSVAEELVINCKKQAGAELCQAQAQVGLTAEAELILMLSSN